MEFKQYKTFELTMSDEERLELISAIDSMVYNGGTSPTKQDEEAMDSFFNTLNYPNR